MSSTTMPTSDPLAVVRYLDVVLVVLAAPFVVLMDGPLAGYLAGAAAWIVGRVAGAALERWARASKDARGQVAVAFAVLMGRAWLVGLTILLVGLKGERQDGLMAAVLTLVAFTVYLAMTVVLRPTERNTPTS